MAGIVAGGAWTLHVLADQAGFMGSNLFYPFTRTRTPGRQMAEADHPWVNVVMIWLACLLVLGNLARQAESPGLGISFPALLLLGGALPLGAAVVASRLLTQREKTWRGEVRAGRDTRRAARRSFTARQGQPHRERPHSDGRCPSSYPTSSAGFPDKGCH